MKNQKAIIITVALFLALISLSCAASQPLSGLPVQPTPRVQRVQRGELGGLPVQPTSPVRRMQPGQPRQPQPSFRQRLTKKQRIEKLEKLVNWYKKEVDRFEQLVKDTRKKIREAKRSK